MKGVECPGYGRSARPLIIPPLGDNHMDNNDLADQLRNVALSFIEKDAANDAPANITDGLFAIARAIGRLADAVEAIEVK